MSILNHAQYDDEDGDARAANAPTFHTIVVCVGRMALYTRSRYATPTDRPGYALMATVQQSVTTRPEWFRIRYLQ